MGVFVISNDRTSYIPNDTNEKCFVSNEEAYPLCKGNGENKCHNCCIYEDYEAYHSPY